MGWDRGGKGGTHNLEPRAENVDRFYREIRPALDHHALLLDALDLRAVLVLDRLLQVLHPLMNR